MDRSLKTTCVIFPHIKRAHLNLAPFCMWYLVSKQSIFAHLEISGKRTNRHFSSHFQKLEVMCFILFELLSLTRSIFMSQPDKTLEYPRGCVSPLLPHIKSNDCQTYQTLRKYFHMSCQVTRFERLIYERMLEIGQRHHLLVQASSLVERAQLQEMRPWKLTI